MSTSSKDVILSEARRMAQAHGYGGMNYREPADRVKMKPASIYHHFPSKADLGAAVAKRYWEDTAANLDSITVEADGPEVALRRYPQVFRRSLENENRLCLGSFMSAEIFDLPEIVTTDSRLHGGQSGKATTDLISDSATVELISCTPDSLESFSKKKRS
jgi:TetR/AcrR family transcriptional repressor of nem operon